MQISDLCRSCTKETVSSDKQHFSEVFVNMFCFCTNIKVINEDQLPKQFCSDCLDKIQISYLFIKEAQRAEVTFRNILSRSETSVIVTPQKKPTPLSDQEITIKHESYQLQTHLSSTPLSDQEIKSNCDNSFVKDTVSITQLNNNIVTKEKSSVNIELTKKKCKIEKETRVDKDMKNKCSVCGKSFTSKAWYVRHMVKEHTDNKLYCTHCLKIFSKQSELSEHMLTHSDGPLACSVCGKRYKRRRHLAAHERAHANTHIYACDKCNMRFRVKSVLIRHMAVHTDVKRYLCSFCGHGFTQACNLEVHMRRHTGEKPFCCASCSFTTSVSSSLRRHERSHGPRVTSYTCACCHKGFLDSGGLARHMRTHTGELPFRCPECGSAFRDSWKRKTHMMRAHGVRLGDIPRMRRDGTTITT